MTAADISRRKEQAALASLAATAVLTLAKFTAALTSGSLAILSEAGHGVLDTAATALTLFAVRAADKPADADHPWGHGKFEAVTALIETGLLFVLAAVVLVTAGQRLMSGEGHVMPHGLAYGVLVASIAVDAVRWRGLSAIAAASGSHALAADALHFSSDLVASCLVLVGLFATSLGFQQGDAVAAVAVALYVGTAGYRLGKRTIDTLVDTAPQAATERLRRLVAAVPGVAGIERLRLRSTGGQVAGEVAILVDRKRTFEQVRSVKDAVDAAIATDVPAADITVYANPKALDDETVLEKVLLLAARRRLAVHHVTLQEIDGRKSVSLDVELDGRMTHGAAHEIASSLERAIAVELGPDIEVETHIEPLDMRERQGRDCRTPLRDAIRAALTRRAAEVGAIEDVHSVRVRKTEVGLIVNYHCRVEDGLTVDDVHAAVDMLDRKIKGDFPDISRIVGHAEPLRRA